MRQAITIVRLHNRKEFEMLAGPETPIHEQLSHFRETLLSTTHDGFAEIIVIPIDTDTIYRRTFVTAKPQPKKDSKNEEDPQ